MSRLPATLRVRVGRVHFESGIPVDRELFAGRLRAALEARLFNRPPYQRDHVADSIADRVTDQIARMPFGPAFGLATKRDFGGANEP